MPIIHSEIRIFEDFLGILKYCVFVGRLSFLLNPLSLNLFSRNGARLSRQNFQVREQIQVILSMESLGQFVVRSLEKHLIYIDFFKSKSLLILNLLETIIKLKFKLIILTDCKNWIKHLNLKRIQLFLTWFKIPINCNDWLQQTFFFCYTLMVQSWIHL